MTDVSHIMFDQIYTNHGNNFKDGIFLTEIRGLYLFTLYWHAGKCDKRVEIYRESQVHSRDGALCITDVDNWAQGACSTLVDLENGDKVMVKAISYSGKKPDCILSGNKASGFLGHLVHPTD